MTSITRRFAIPLGLAALVPESSRAGDQCQQERRRAQDRCGSSGPDRGSIEAAIIDYFEAENTQQITLTSFAGNPQEFTPTALGELLASAVVESGFPVCG